MQHHAQSSLASALAGALIGGVALLGCPQLLDDGFETVSRPPSLNLSSGDLGPDGGMSAAGGSGGASDGTAGAGGTEPSRDAGQDPALSSLGALLLHRYPFDGAGSTVVDSAGNANGTTDAVQSNGQLTLSGSDYVDLPNGIISRLESVTIEAWVSWSVSSTWSESSEWQLLFSFGTNANGESRQGSGTTYLALTPQDSAGSVRASYTLSGYYDENYASSTDHLPTTAGTQVVMVVDGAQGSLTVYVDGARAGSDTGLSLDLSAIDDVNNWIGRSQFTEDKNFVGDVLDFRIYGGALSDAQVALSYAHGADANF